MRFNNVGPQGPRGYTGPQGPPGESAPRVGGREKVEPDQTELTIEAEVKGNEVIAAVWERADSTSPIAVLVEERRVTFTWVRPPREPGAFRWHVAGRLDY